MESRLSMSTAIRVRFLIALCITGLFVTVVRGQVCTPVWETSIPATDNIVFDLTTFDDGSGPAVYAAGDFLNAGGSPFSHIARWDGASWTDVGGGIDNRVFFLRVLTTTAGTMLYAGGDFTSAGGSPANRIAAWDGSTWSALGSGFSAFLRDACVFDDGSGPAIYAAGDFPGYIARWDGSTWTTVGGGTDARVRTLAVYDDGSGPALYAGGDFTSAGGTAASYLARWDGTSWTDVGGSVGGSFVFTLKVFDLGSGPELFVGGRFTSVGASIPATNIARWDGIGWSALGDGLGGGASDAVRDMDMFDSGNGFGAFLYAGGDFASSGATTLNNIAEWNGVSWTPLDGGADATVRALLATSDTSGPALAIGGDFTTVGAMTADNLALWRGCPNSLFMRGDANSDGSLNIADAVFIIGYLFTSGAMPSCFDAADVNDDGLIDISDPISIITYQFNGGPAPAAPYPMCGDDSNNNSDTFDCLLYPSC